MGQLLNKFNETTLDSEILNLHSNNHVRRKYIRGILTRDFLHELLVDDGLSVYHVYKDILLPKGVRTQPSHLFDLCEEFGIPTLSCKDRANTEAVKARRVKTSLEKYGVPHVMCKGTRFYKRRDRTVKNRYGVSNVFQRDETKRKIEETMMKRYGVPSSLPLAWAKCSNGRRSGPHKIVEEYLTSIGVNFISECTAGRFRKFNRYLGTDYSPIPDIIVDSKKVVIEVHGDIWHANPRKYKSTDIIHKYEGNVSAKQIWAFDRSRKRQIESFGYKVVVVWEHDIRRNMARVKSKLSKLFSNGITN